MADARVPFHAVDNVALPFIAHDLAIVADEDAPIADRLFASMAASDKLVHASPVDSHGRIITKTEIAPTLKALLDFQVKAKHQVPPVAPINVEDNPVQVLQQILAQLVAITARLDGIDRNVSVHGRLLALPHSQKHNLKLFRQGQDGFRQVCNSAGQAVPEDLPAINSMQAIQDLEPADLIAWARYYGAPPVVRPVTAARRSLANQHLLDNVLGDDWRDFALR
ncbi:hypothetical protein ACM66B_003344 [Microbotryomycetes sp. NB124-2]